MDINGWIDIKDIIRQFKKRDERRYHWLRPHHFRAVSETDPKGRYEVRGNMIRATYGHTSRLNWIFQRRISSLYFPCGPDEVEALLEAGLIPSGRAHVHLSGSIRSQVMQARCITIGRSYLTWTQQEWWLPAIPFGMRVSLSTLQRASILNSYQSLTLMTQKCRL